MSPATAALTIAATAVLAILVRAAAIRSQRRRAEGMRTAAVPEVVDLFRIAAAAGHPVAQCLDLVAARAPPAAQAPLADAGARRRRGTSLADALAVLGAELGPLGATLTDALAAAAATGAPLGPVLDRVALAAHDHRRRSAEETARRLPVTLLFPLVLCILPAFVLLAVVPLLAGSLASLAH